MNSSSPVAASAADPMSNAPASIASNQSMNANSAMSGNNPQTASAANHLVNAWATATDKQAASAADTTPMMNRKGTVITAPTNLQTAFSTQFPNASKVQWYNYNSADVPIDWELTGWPTLTNKDYAVMYNIDADSYYAWYDASGNWVGSTSMVKNHSSLPAPVMQLLSSKYAGYTIAEVHAETYKKQSGFKIELNKGTDKMKTVVDANGNILKQKTKTVGGSGNVNKSKIKN